MYKTDLWYEKSRVKISGIENRPVYRLSLEIVLKHTLSHALHKCNPHSILWCQM